MLPESWEKGAHAGYEELTCLQSAGATPDELRLITLQLAADHRDNVAAGYATTDDLARAAGYLEMAGHVADEALYKQEAELDRLEAEPEPEAEAG